MDLQALRLSTGPNASNASEGPENLTLAGESWGRRGAGPPIPPGMGEDFTPGAGQSECLGNFI